MTEKTEEERAADDAATKRRFDVYEIIAAVLLGVATVAIAWSANQSNLWGGSQDKLLAQSVRVSNEAVDSFQKGDTTQQLDQLLFVELLIQFDTNDEENFTGVEEQIFNNLSEAGVAAFDLWAEERTEFPFEEDAYYDSLFAEGEELSAESDRLYDTAVQANTNGDNYVLASTLMATVLFFAGHNQPGGGFAGGLVLGAVMALRSVTGLNVPQHPIRMMAIGGVVIGCVALAPLLIGDVALDQYIWEAQLPVLGKVKAGTALVFDVGVVLIVLGLILAMLDALAAPADPSDTDVESSNNRSEPAR